MYGDACGGDGENGTDLGYVFEVEWAGCDEIQAVRGDFKKKESLLNNWVDGSTRWKGEGGAAGRAGTHWAPRSTGQLARDPELQSQLCLFLALRL